MKAKLLLMTVYAVIIAIASVPVFANSQLEQRIQRLESENKTRSKLQLEMNMQLVELQKEVKELRGILEEHDYKLQQIQERQRDLYRDIESRLSGQPPKQSQNQVSNSNLDTSSAKIDSKRTTYSNDERTEFEAAFKMVRSKEYSKAVQSFEVFLHKYPSGDYSDNARFWVGQVYFAQREFDRAERQFNLLKTQYPQSSKLSSAMLKLADIKVRQKKWDEAKAIYNEVLTKYTGAQQQLARKGLQDIKKAGH